MKKLLFTILLSSVFAIQTYADKIKGQIIKGGKTQEVTLRIPKRFLKNEPNYAQMEFAIKYFDSDQTKHRLQSSDADEVRFEFNGETIRLLSRKINEERGSVFLKLEVDGELKLFSHYYFANAYVYNGNNDNAISHDYYFQRGDEPLHKSKKKGFKKDIKNFLTECPALIEAINNKTFKKKDLFEITSFYNQNCD